MQQRFVHLRVHTEFSLVDGLVRVKPLMKTLVARGMCAVAVTDYCNLFATVKIYKSAVDAGIKPIIGADLPCYDPENPDVVSTLVFLCMSGQGYKNLTCLVSKAYQEGQEQGQPRVHYSWINEYSEGIIVLSGGKFGDIGQALLANDLELAKKRALHWSKLFPSRFYLEIQRTGRADETLYNEKLIDLAEHLQLPLVATN
ncbi:MAG: PHP domain-containing protein, partial [bacterium]|nr:PHP domain-containing protein [bacterium]